MITAASLRGDHAKEFVTAIGAGEVQNVGPGFEAGAGDGGLVRFPPRPRCWPRAGHE